MPTQSARTAPAALLLMLASGSAWADQLHVPAQYPTIQAAIDAAVDGDEIVIAEGTYRELLDGRNKSLTYTGAGMGLTVLSGDLNEDGVPDGTVLTVNDTTSMIYPTLTMRDLTVREGTSGVVSPRVGRVTLHQCCYDSCGAATPSSALNIENQIQSVVEIDECIFVNNTQPIRAVGFGSVLFNHVNINGNTKSIEIQSDGNVSLESVSVTRNEERAIRILGRSLATVSNSVFADNVGGAMHFVGYELTVADTRFEGNIGPSSANVPQGGAIYISTNNSDYIVRIERCAFSDNHARSGGAIRAEVRSLEILDSSFETNTAGIVVPGGGIGSAAYIHATKLLLDRCTFARNAGTETGPLNIHTSDNVVSLVSNCEFRQNGREFYDGGLSTNVYGGGMNILGGRVLVDSCVFRENRGMNGGAIGIWSLARTSVIRNSLFYANSASVVGGAVGTETDIRIASSVFVGNTSAAVGGAIGQSNARSTRYPSVTSCSFVDNEAPQGQIAIARLNQPYEITNSILVSRSRHNLFWAMNTPLGTIYLHPIHPSNLLSVNHASIGFVRLPNNGGDGWGDDLSTPGVDEGANDDFGDLRLTPGSPAIDAGDNAAIPLDIYDIDADGDTAEPVTGDFDLDGNPRFVDAPGMPNVYPGIIAGGPIDLGPYEFQGVSCWADVNADGVLSPADFSAWINAFNTNRPRADQNRDGDLTPADFSAWIANYNAGC